MTDCIDEFGVRVLSFFLREAREASFHFYRRVYVLSERGHDCHEHDSLFRALQRERLSKVEFFMASELGNTQNGPSRKINTK